MNPTFPVTSFPDSGSLIVQGLKARFAQFSSDFPGVRIGTIKSDKDSYQYEVIVVATGGQELNNSTTKQVPVSILIFAPDYGSANGLASKTAEFLKSLPILPGPLAWAEVTNDGEHLANLGPQFVRNVIGRVIIKASKTTLY